jgi:phosphatidylglycerol lysyltransferase
MEVGATVLLCGLPYALAFGLLLDLSLVFGAEKLAPLFRISSQWLFALGCLGLVKDVAYLLFIRLRKAPIRLGGWSVNLPSLRLTWLQLAVGITDIMLIAAVLYLLLPDTARIGFLPFIAVYLASVLAGVLSHVPAGLGVLESMLLLLMPQVPPEQLLAAVLTYRAIYEVIPLVIALAMWGSYEMVARDGARSRLMRQATAPERPPTLP